MNQPETEKDLEILDMPAGAPATSPDHHLTFDRQKNCYAFRVVVDVGAKVKRKRVCVRFRAPDEFLARIKRDTILCTFRALGVSIAPRIQTAKPKPRG